MVAFRCSCSLSERSALPLAQRGRVRRALKRLGKPYEEYRYDAGHGSLVVDESLKQLAMEIDFVAKHLGTPPRSSAGRGYRIASSSGFTSRLKRVGLASGFVLERRMRL